MKQNRTPKIKALPQAMRRICVRLWNALGRFFRSSSARCLYRFLRVRVLPLFCACCLLGVVICGCLLCISAAVCDRVASRVYTSDELLSLDESYDCILVLGCRVYHDGTPSPMLYDRVSVASSLYLNGVAPQLLMSGDSHKEGYDEVGCMKQTAIDLGVAADAIVTDPYGLSTYDSIARAVEAYKGLRVVIVTQEYHLYRALYVAEKLGLDAVGVSADLRPYANQPSRDAREVLARCKDVYYALKQPPAAKAPNE